MFIKQNTLLVYNIPKDFRSKHLRRFFHLSIESNHFKCFHFRHRKAQYLSTKEINFEAGTYTCIIKLMKESLVEKFLDHYNTRPWNEDNVESCKIYHLNVKSENVATDCDKNDGKTLDLDDLYHNIVKTIPEMRPSKLLKNGNVGTPLSHFIQLIRDCSLPPSLLPKLGIHLQNLSIKRKHSCIAWNYNDQPFDHVNKKVYSDIESEYITEVDDEEEEEWDRYAMVTDDPSKLEPRERHFEQKTEVVWEKGGPGLVWHMDLNYWEQFEEEAEREVDDWDVDFEEGDFRSNPVLKDDYRTFYKKDECLKKPYSRSKVKSNFHDEWNSISVYATPIIEDFDDQTSKKANIFRQPKIDSKLKKSKNKSDGKMGCFEEYSNHYGSKIMKKHGWKKGKGLGQSGDGIKDAILADGQFSSDKRGVGYINEKKLF